MDIKIGSIRLHNGSDVTTVAVLNEGYSHIGIDDHCYVVINGKDGEANFSSHIFREAHEILLLLPPNVDCCEAIGEEKLKELVKFNRGVNIAGFTIYTNTVMMNEKAKKEESE